MRDNGLTIFVDVEKLIVHLESNKEKYDKTYQKLLKGFEKKSKKFKKEYEEWSKQVALKKVIGHQPIAPPKPEDKTELYNFYIGMLKVHQDKVIELTETLYKSLWLDKWDWGYSFWNTIQTYSDQFESDELALLAADYGTV